MVTSFAGLFYDARERRLGPLLRGHLLLYDRREAPAYSAATGWRLLGIFVVLELVVGPRAHGLTWLGLATPPRWLTIALLLAVAVLAARFWAKAGSTDVGFLPWRQWTATEKLYLAQIVVAAPALFAAVHGGTLGGLLGRPAGWRVVAAVVAVELLWGFYQEVNHRGILQTELTRRFGSIWGPLAANLVYTIGPLHLYHFGVARPWPATAAILAATFGIGLVFAFIFRRTRNVWLVGLMHGIGNAFVNGGASFAAMLAAGR